VLALRSLRWPDDRRVICALDTSFTTARVYRVVAAGTAFTLQKTTVSPALHRVFDLTGEVDGMAALDHVLIAERDSRVAGVAALSHDVADRRALVRHLYVDRAYRRQGIGRALMEAMVARAEQWQVRCVWLETQDVNYAAIQFYQRARFQWCGLDLSLDERNGSITDETAVFFMRPLK
jgi:ribosomal protein S18 acetylase RimI-like enzyme